MEQDVVSFMLRFVRETGDEQHARWRGVVRHVQGNAERQFTQFAEALDFMQMHVGATAAGADGEQMDDFNPLAETARLWGAYNKRLLESWQQVMERGVQAPEQMQQTINTLLEGWGLPTRKQEAAATERIETLTTQIEQLTAAVSALQARLDRMEANASDQ